MGAGSGANAEFNYIVIDVQIQHFRHFCQEIRNQQEYGTVKESRRNCRESKDSRKSSQEEKA